MNLALDKVELWPWRALPMLGCTNEWMHGRSGAHDCCPKRPAERAQNGMAGGERRGGCVQRAQHTWLMLVSMRRAVLAILGSMLRICRGRWGKAWLG